MDAFQIDTEVLRRHATRVSQVAGDVGTAQSAAGRVDSSEIAPWFGQPGGGPQHRFVEMLIGDDGKPKPSPINQEELVKRGIIPDPITQRSAR